MVPPRALVLDDQPGQNVALEVREAFSHHGHPFESDGYGRLSDVDVCRCDGRQIPSHMI
jgi:hypothetical protein